MGSTEPVNLWELYAERSVFFEESRKMALMNRDTDVESRLVDTAGEGEGGMCRESGTDVCTLPGVKWTAGGKRPCSHSALWDAREGWGRVWKRRSEGGDVCVHVAESHCPAETNTHCKATMLQF